MSRLACFCLSILVASITPAGCWSQQSTAAFGGVVVTDSGSPVSGALVGYIKPGPCTRTPSGGLTCALPMTGSARTGADGRFLFTGLPAGEYNLCARAIESNQLDNCEWIHYGELGDRGATLQDGENITHLRMVLRTGSIFRVHLFDRDHFMEWGFGPTVSVTDTITHPIHRMAQEAGPPNYVFTAPIPRTLNPQLFLVSNTALVFLTESGESIITRGSSIVAPGGADVVDLHLTATAPIVNAASFWPNVSPGEITSLFDSGITNVSGIVQATTLPLPTQLAGTSVLVNGTPAPLFAVANVNGAEQINFQFPREYQRVSGDPSRITLEVTPTGLSRLTVSPNPDQFPESSLVTVSPRFSTAGRIG